MPLSYKCVKLNVDEKLFFNLENGKEPPSALDHLEPSLNSLVENENDSLTNAADGNSVDVINCDYNCEGHEQKIEDGYSIVTI